MKDDGNHNSYLPMNRMKMAIGSKTFTAILHNNPTAAALKKMFPLTLAMTELNRNEKYFQLAQELPADAAKARTIQASDLSALGVERAGSFLLRRPNALLHDL